MLVVPSGGHAALNGLNGNTTNSAFGQLIPSSAARANEVHPRFITDDHSMEDACGSSGAQNRAAIETTAKHNHRRPALGRLRANHRAC